MDEPDLRSDILDDIIPETVTTHQAMLTHVEEQSWASDDYLYEKHTLEDPASSSPMSFNIASSFPLQLSSQETDDDFVDLPLAPGAFEDYTQLFGDAEPSTRFGNPVQLDQPTAGPSRQNRNNRVISQIEAVFEDIADALLAERTEITVSLTAHCQQTTNNQQRPPRLAQRSNARDTISFPGKSAEDAWRFSVVVRILELMHEALTTNTVITKRDLYYRDPKLFGKQAVVDRYVDHIARAFGVPRASMNVIAAAKGLMLGAATLYRKDGSRLDLSSSTEGCLIPCLDEISSVAMDAVQWVLVIEKEATFQSLITSQYWQNLRWQSIVLTGKGYPDIATRAMARFLTKATPQNRFSSPQAYGLMDFDPDGIAIFSTYHNGSRNMQSENEELTLPEMRSLGLHSEHITDQDHTHCSQGLMHLSGRDRRKARRMLMQEHGHVCMDQEADRRHQLQVMLMLNLKAELQILDALPGGLLALINAGIRQ